MDSRRAMARFRASLACTRANSSPLNCAGSLGTGSHSAAFFASIHRDIVPDITGITAFSGPAGVGTHEQPAAGRTAEPPGRQRLYSGSTTSCHTSAARSFYSGARDRTDHTASADAVSGYGQRQYQFFVYQSVAEYEFHGRRSSV